MFSTRTAWNLEEGSLAAAIRQARATSQPLIDLTVSNPTVCDFTYEPVAIAATPIYDPDPRGLLSARAAVADYYAPAAVDPAHILLTTSTSEAYSFLFRLLCDPGDDVLAALPSYPLFDFLGDILDVRISPYPLFYDFGWWIDFAELERRLTPRTRALLLVHPNNPTGHATSSAERIRLEAFCTRHALALIVDEVFLDYALEDHGGLEDHGLGTRIESFATGPHPCLTFIVSGLSKIAALPQMKLAWLAALGPAPLRDEALRRLEVISDTFLSVPAPTQLALPGWLAARRSIQQQIIHRVRQNLATLAGPQFELLPVKAGWAAVIKVRESIATAHPDQPRLQGQRPDTYQPRPQGLGEHARQSRSAVGATHNGVNEVDTGQENGRGQTAHPDLAERLVREAGVILHPGSFYGFPGNRYLVLSLLLPHAQFIQGVDKLNDWMNLYSQQNAGWQ